MAGPDIHLPDHIIPKQSSSAPSTPWLCLETLYIKLVTEVVTKGSPAGVQHPQSMRLTSDVVQALTTIAQMQSTLCKQARQFKSIPRGQPEKRGNIRSPSVETLVHQLGNKLLQCNI